MYDRLGQVVSRHWLLVFLAWLVLAAGLRLKAPRWDDVTHDGDLEHLPREMVSVRGGELLNRAFPANQAKSQIVFVVSRDDAQLEPADFEFADLLATTFDGLRQDETQPSPEDDALPILHVWTRQTQVVGDMLRSPDRRAVMVVLQLSNEFMATDNIRVLDVVERQVNALRSKLPAGLELGITGSAAIGGDMLESAKESIANTELFTVILVVAILLVVYRAPLLVLVPLVAIGVSISVATGSIAALTQLHRLEGMDWWNFKVFTTTKIFVVVILFGAGTDYCLFLISRYREELARGHPSREAVARALGSVGSALAASALTTIVGLGMMFFADFGKFTNSGPAIAICLIVAMLACMSLAPAMLAALGEAVFWPFRSRPKLASSPPRDLPTQTGSRIFSGFWKWAAGLVLARPGLILVLAILLMAYPAVEGLSVETTYDLLGELSRDRPSVRGTALLRKHFPPGKTGPLTVLAWQSDADFESVEGEKQIARLTKTLYDLEGVVSVRSVSEPMGDPPGYFQPFTKRGLMKVAAKRHPITKAQFVTQVPELRGRVARFDLVLQYDPFSAQAIGVLDEVDDRLLELAGDPESAWHKARFDFVGTTAGIRDLKSVTESDYELIQRLVVVAVLFVLVVILRHPLVCFYLILSVLWSFFVTIGATELFFQWMYGDTYHGLDWKVPLFLFVILIAIGEDYNIYLATRVFEEQERRGPREGLRFALISTGGIITSCGVIMAGTFVSMTTGTLRGITELGFALSLGVLLDTFVVRTVLVPAFLALLCRKPAAAEVAASTDGSGAVSSLSVE